MAIPRRIVRPGAQAPAPANPPPRRPAAAPTIDELDMLAGEADLEAIAADYESTYEEFGGAQFLTLAQGENVLRFLPPRPGQTVPWVRVKKHSTPFGAAKRLDVVCPESVPNEDGTKRRCPICARYAVLAASPNPGDKDAAKALKAKLSVYAEVVDVTNNETAAKGVQIYRYGKQVDDDLFGLLRGRGAVNFFDKREGCPVSIRRDGSGLNTEYKDIKAITQEKAPVEVEWLRQRPDSIDWLKRLPTGEQMAEMMDVLGVPRTGTAGARAQPQAVPAVRAPQAATTRPTRPARPAPAPVPSRSRSAADDVEDYEYSEVEY